MIANTSIIVCTSDCAVLAGSVDGSVRVYDLRMGRLQVLQTFYMQAVVVVKLIVSVDGSIRIKL